MRYSRAEALRYLRAQANDEAAGILVDTVFLKLRNEVQVRHVLQKHSCTVLEDGVLLDCGVKFTSRSLAKHLEGCAEVLLLAATLGSKVDVAIRRLALGSVAEGAAAQAVAACLIEGYCDEVQERVETTLKQRPRFSPGYGDWDLAEQRKLFAILECEKKLGLTLTDGLMMAPSKSVTAVIGLSESVACVWNKCMQCGNTSCPYREGS
ncbi:MAG: Vitamin B12 dependent methionine synthase activation subunit [Phascolarctobacterium sp.]|nr:Vitamin B12 dependent methionine synthase activation subunit [Phascolarctobacterium sp.]